MIRTVLSVFGYHSYDRLSFSSWKFNKNGKPETVSERDGVGISNVNSVCNYPGSTDWWSEEETIYKVNIEIDLRIDMLLPGVDYRWWKTCACVLEEYVSQMPALTVAASFSNALQAKNTWYPMRQISFFVISKCPAWADWILSDNGNWGILVWFYKRHIQNLPLKDLILMPLIALLKPIALERFRIAIDKCLEILRRKKIFPESIFCQGWLQNTTKLTLKTWFILSPSMNTWLIIHQINE